MAPMIRDQLPVIKQLMKWFTKEGVIIDSLIFKLHHQASAFVILIGFVFTVVENYLDHKSIQCWNQNSLNKYAHSYCWLHGTSYVKNQLQGKATGCYVDHTKLDTQEDALITSYYLWLPYLLSLLFALAKLPHSLWKRCFENNLMSNILAGVGGNDDGWDSNNKKEEKTEDKSNDDGEAGEKGKGGNNNQGGGNNGNNGNNQGGGGKGKNKGNNNNKKDQGTGPKLLVKSFVEFRPRFSSYHLWFCVLETLNIGTLLFSMMITHWILNYKFLNYGTEVLNYLSIYGEYYRRREQLHDPTCELFPTEVACVINYGSSPGYTNTENYLCILSNNLFNQKYFFVLWVWWMFLLVISIFGFIYRAARFLIPQVAQHSLARVYHGSLNANLSTYDCFVLEYLVRNLNSNPVTVRKFFAELNAINLDNKDSEADLGDGLKKNLIPNMTDHFNSSQKNEFVS